MADYLFFGGPILTMESPQDAPEALVTRGGQIGALGPLKALRAKAPGARPIDLKGRALLPGFIDSHSHFVQYAGTLRHADLSGCGSFEQLAGRLKNFIRQNGVQPGQAVVGFGYDQTLLQENRHPDRALLDGVSRAHPILISHVSGHMGVLNSLGLQALHLRDTEPDPPGGRYGRDEDGRLTGFLEESAFFAQAGGLLPAPGETEQDELLRRAQALYFAQGVTTAQEGFAKEYEVGLLRRAADQGLLQLDLVAYVDICSHSRLLPHSPRERQTYRGHFRVGGYKLFLDGSPQGRTAWMSADYADEPGYRGYPALTRQQTEDYVARAQAEKAQLLCHCNGDAAAARLIAAHKKPATQRNVMVHAQLVRPDQLPAMKAAGIMPSFFTAHTYYWGDVHLKHFGPARTAALSPAASAKAVGLPYTFHMDSPVLPPNALDMLWCACNRRTRLGLDLAQGEELSPWDALLGLTRYGAWQYGEEKEKGTLAPGKKADLVVLSADPRAIPPEALRRLEVEATFKGGKLVYSRSGWPTA